MPSSYMDHTQCELLIRGSGERLTKQRVAIIAALSSERFPVTIKELAKKVPADQSTLYRSLETLVGAGLVKKVHLDEDSARYEVHAGRKHHHHIQCTKCGVIEDVDICDRTAEKKVLARSKRFSSITDHSLEFFGICKPCTRM